MVGRISLAALVAALALAGCARPLPADRLSYAGEWHAAGMDLLITPEGRVKYKRVTDHMTKSLDAPLKEYQGDNFVVGVGFMSTTFVVTAPPHEDGGVWKMTVDGVELTRAAG